jgi:N-methylhydantoinase A
LTVPSVDLIEIGAGGGSLASIGDTGVLEVGPQSSGADPGPICYGRGGRGPTVTDADLVLGYLDPNYFLGGAMHLDVEGAKAGIDREVGQRLELSAVEAAYGIHEVVNENMASAIRMHVSERGGDLRHITLVAFGGAGPVHAWGVARSLGIPRILVPRGAGVLSALGFLVAPVSFESSRTRPSRLSETSAPVLEQVYAELEREAGAVVERAAPGSPVTFTRSAEMSYAGQSHHIRVALAHLRGGTLDLSRIGEAFDAEYRRLYGLAYDHLEIQVVTLIVTATALKEVVSVATPFAGGSGDGRRAFKRQRPAYDATTRTFVAHAVYAMDDLEADTIIEGPAIIEERASTLVVGAGGVATVDERGWIMVTLPGERA